MYLYLKEKDDFSCLPEDLLKQLGVLEFSMELEMTADRKLARENPKAVLENLKNRGFHLQLPPQVSIENQLSSYLNKNHH